MSLRNPATRYALNTDGTQWRVVDGEAVVVHLASSYYYGLNQTGTLLWSLMATTPRSIDELAEHVVLAYNVDAERARADTVQVVQELVAEGLIREQV